VLDETVPINPWLIALAVVLPTFMEVLDTSIASVALPHIAGSLSASTDEATWVLTSYLVANAVILPASGWFSLRIGRKRFLLFCIVLFTLASFACGAAASMGMILVARAIQGAGGGALQPLSQAILLESFPLSKRGMAMAVFGLGVVVAPIIGPTLGGWLTDQYSWRWALYINVPVGVLAVLMISPIYRRSFLHSFRQARPHRRHRSGLARSLVGRHANHFGQRAGGRLVRCGVDSLGGRNPGHRLCSVSSPPTGDSSSHREPVEPKVWLK
jgi:MFS family permease